MGERKLLMSKISALRFAFYTLFVIANILAIVHLFSIVESIFSRQYALYNSWIGYVSIGFDILIVLSIMQNDRFRHFSCLLFYLFIATLALYNTPYVMVFHDLVDGKISLPGGILIVVGFVLPIFGILISSTAIHFSRKGII